MIGGKEIYLLPVFLKLELRGIITEIAAVRRRLSLRAACNPVMAAWKGNRTIYVRTRGSRGL